MQVDARRGRDAKNGECVGGFSSPKKPSNLAERISRKAAGEMGALGIRLVPETAFQPRWRVRSRKERCPHTIAQPTAGERDSRSGAARALPMASEYRDVFWRADLSSSGSRVNTS